MRRSHLLVCSLCLASAIHAADIPLPAPDESEFLQELPIVLTASRLPQPLSEAPAAVTVIDREMIRATGYRDLARLFRLVPGMQIGQERGSSHWVTYHGLGNDFPSAMQVLVDGRSVYSPGSFGGVDWTGLPVTLDEIDRIEIVRGSNSVAYGSNAFLGVINIITRHTADAPGRQASLWAGDADIQGAAVEWGATGDAGGLRLNARINRDEGFTGLNDGQLFKTLSLRADRQLGPRDEVMFRLAASDGDREGGYPDSTYDNNAERSWHTRNTTLHLQWRHAPSADEEWLLHYYRNEDSTRDEWVASALRLDLDPIRTAYVPLNRNRVAVRDNLELQHRTSPSPDIRTVWGLEGRHDQVDAPFLFYSAPQQDSHMARLFGTLEWRFRPDWQLHAGALAEKFSDSDLLFSPRAFANWHFAPDQTLRLGYARVWRHPTLFERYGDIRAIDPADDRLLVQPYLPNPALRPPRMDSVEIGYVGHAKTWNTSLDVRVFHERITDFIQRVSHPENIAPLLAPILPSAQYENLTSPVTLRGVEYQIESRPWQGGRLLWTHTLIDAECKQPFISRLTAPYVASLSWFQSWAGGWSSTLTALRMGPIAGGDGFVPRYEYAAPAYTTLDLRIARSLQLGNTPIEVALVGTNLGGHHQEIADRSEQFLHGQDPVNRTAPRVWLTLSLNPF